MTCKKNEVLSTASHTRHCTSKHTDRMTDSTTARVYDLLTELQSLRGSIPFEMQNDFRHIGVRFATGFFAPRWVPPPVVKVQCSAMHRNGTQCRHMCLASEGMCRTHIKAQAAKTAKVKCTKTTAKGDPCKCSAFKGLNVCWSHGKKEGLITPSETECSICYEETTTETRKKTSCGHVFHKACLGTWVDRHAARRPPCPMCRKPLSRPRGSTP
jgi:hypothetical protein